MVTGSYRFAEPLAVLADRIRAALASTDCRVHQLEDGREIGYFWPGRVGRYPVVGAFRLSVDGAETRVEYQAEVAPSDRLMGVLWATLFFWAVLPPIVTYRAFRNEPREFVNRILGKE